MPLVGKQSYDRSTIQRVQAQNTTSQPWCTATSRRGGKKWSFAAAAASHAIGMEAHGFEPQCRRSGEWVRLVGHAGRCSASCAVDPMRGGKLASPGVRPMSDPVRKAGPTTPAIKKTPCFANNALRHLRQRSTCPHFARCAPPPCSPQPSWLPDAQVGTTAILQLTTP